MCCSRLNAFTARVSLLYAPEVMDRSNAFGEVNTPRSRCPFALMRLGGIMLPTKGTPVVGSRTTISAPEGDKDFEKSPLRSARVGSVAITRSFCKLGFWSQL